MNKLMFGKNVKIITSEKYTHDILDCLKNYEDSNSKDFDVIVNIGEKNNKKEVATNPKILSNIESGFVTKYRNVEVSWGVYNGILHAYIYINKKSMLRNLVSKIISMEFSIQDEMIDQMLHELILVPMTYFFKNLMPIHAASVTKNGEAYIFTGTGGVGKSSALLSLRDAGFDFLSDDIAIADDNGVVWGNMAKPKIYGYNCVGNNIKDLILKEKGGLNKLHFNVKNIINPAKVRRKVSPKDLFSGGVSLVGQPKKMFFLVRENVEYFSVNRIANELARDMSVSIISAEYSEFHRFIEWHNYNCIATDNKPILEMKSVYDAWKKVFEKAFFATEIYKISIPINMEHESYQKEIKALINEI